MPDSRIDELYEPKRKTDRSGAARVSRFIVRWSPILVLLYTVLYTWLISTGFGWNTPKEAIDTLKAEVRTNRAATVLALDSLAANDIRQRAVQERILDVLEILSIQPCLDLRKRSDPYVFRRLKCEDILKGAS